MRVEPGGVKSWSFETRTFGPESQDINVFSSEDPGKTVNTFSSGRSFYTVVSVNFLEI